MKNYYLKFKLAFNIFWFFLALSLLASCQIVRIGEDDSAINGEDLFNQPGFVRQELLAGDFSITVYYKIKDNTQPTNIYIEGDGRAWNNGYPPANPTPKQPIALKLAIIDGGSSEHKNNVIYIARPCQYSRNRKNCDNKYWTGSRYSADVVYATNNVIDSIKRQYKLKSELQLIGFSGGASVALLATLYRTDVMGIRTVAGNINHVALNNYHQVDQLTDSLNPLDFVAYLGTIPQVHYIASNDNIVKPEFTYEYMALCRRPDCVKMKIIPNTTHNEGWEEPWNKLLAEDLPHCELRN